MTSGRVPRRATKFDPDSQGHESRLLANWRALDAYVLLGDPGAGKTCALKDECNEANGLWLDARNVAAGIVPSDISGRTVFIDGLDEVRAGASDGGNVSFDAIRKWLHDQGRPRFRLSCREADWRGPSDANRLKEVAPKGEVAELHLESLSDEEIEAVVRARSREVPDADAFIAAADRNGLRELLRSPLLLDLMMTAQAGGSGPRTRKAIYEAACRQLATEHNDEHLSVRPVRPEDVEQLLDDAGSICAIALLSGQRGLASGSAKDEGSFTAMDLCEELELRDASAALASKVFSTDAGLAVPRHRSIAEYLGGRALARRIAHGLPLGRVLALMQGIDGVPVEPLRGLWAWLAVHHAHSRARLIEIDPLGFVLNGDVAELTTAERRDLLHALRAASERDPWLRNGSWVSHPFGPLATQGLAAELEALLRETRRDLGHLSFVDYLFDALRHGEPLLSLGPVLTTWIEDGAAPSHLRVAAYKAWKHCAGFPSAQALAWLRAIEAGTLVDADDELCGTLLRDQYPKDLPPDRVFDHWHRAKQRNLIGTYYMFWRRELWVKTPQDAYPALAQAWLQRRVRVSVDDLRADEGTELPSSLLAATLEHAGDDATDATLYEWMGMVLDEYGFSRLEDQEHAVRNWLAQRPQRMKALMALGLSKITPDEQGRWAFWPAESRLHGAARPRDWLFWLLDQTASARSPELAQYCFFPAAHAAMTPVTGLDAPSMEEVEAWVGRHKERWPQAEQWLEDAWSMPIDHWQGDHERRRKQHRAQKLDTEARRKQAIEPRLPSLFDGTATPGLLYQVAIAHEHGFTDVRGETPLERVRNYLVSDEATAQRVIDALPRVLDRDDLPSVDEAIALEAKNKQHYIRPAALLAARFVHERDPQAALAWPQSRAERLVAYYLTDGSGDMPGWYRVLAQHRPEWVAPVLVRYARPKFKRKGNPFFAGLWALGSEADHAPLARLALPALLDAFPLRASEAARGVLNRKLLPALSVLDVKEAAALVRLRLRQTAMDPMQRICWLVADLPHRVEAASELAALVGRNERRAVLLGAAFHEQGGRIDRQIDPQSVKHLIEMLAPITSRDRGRDGWVTAGHHRSDTVHGLISALASDPSDPAKAALQALSQAPSLEPWREDIRYALRTQAAHVREARYTVPSPREVALTLARQAPANPADLRALVVQHLDDLVAEWRGKNSFALKYFWRIEGKKPQIENECRDLLIDRLRERLKPLNVHVGRECSAAQDTRIDMCVEFMRDGRRIALPIEVKKEDNDHLWTAWRDQLQSLYTIDPDTQGFGLYLLLWFSVRVKPHPEGVKPLSAKQLRSALEERIPAESRHRLTVQVLDLSWPAEAVRPAEKLKA
jgi:hypothetical protein